MKRKLTIEIRATDKSFGKMAEAEEVFKRMSRVLSTDELGLVAFWMPTKPSGDRCPVCKELIDLDKATAVGPKGTEFEGKAVHGHCRLRLLQEKRNGELAKEREIAAF